jgi:hypothetical protein
MPTHEQLNSPTVYSVFSSGHERSYGPAAQSSGFFGM